MNVQKLRIGFGILISLCLCACQFSMVPATETPTATFTMTPTKTATLTSTPTLKPTATATETPVPTATDEPLVCTIEDTLQRAKELFPDRDVKFTSSRLESLAMQEFAIIIVNPEIPLVTSDAQVQVYVDMAFRDALDLSQQLVRSDPCVEELSDVIDAVVIDQWNNGWLSVQWKFEDIPKSGNMSEYQMNQVYEDTFFFWTRSSACEDYVELPPDACQWKDIEEKIYWHFGFEGTPPGTEFYLILIDDYVTLWGEWRQSDFALGYGVTSIFSSILNMALEGECLYPQPNGIQFVVKDEKFVTKYIGIYEAPYDGNYMELDTITIIPVE